MSKISLATYLRNRIAELGMSNSEVAKRANISRQTWYKLLNADIEEARLSTLFRVASALDTHVSDLLRIYYSEYSFSPSRKQANGNMKFSSGFVADVTYPLNSTVLIGEAFVKTWRVINIGRQNWKNLSLLCLDDQSSNITPYLLEPHSSEIIIPDTKPSGTVDLSISFKAPMTPGTVISEWQASNMGQLLNTETFSTLRCIVKVIST